MSSNIIESLRDDSKYYGDFGKKYLSNSDIYSLLNNPKNFRISQKQRRVFVKGNLEVRSFNPGHLVCDVLGTANERLNFWTIEEAVDVVVLPHKVFGVRGTYLVHVSEFSNDRLKLLDKRISWVVAQDPRGSVVDVSMRCTN